MSPTIFTYGVEKIPLPNSQQKRKIRKRHNHRKGLSWKEYYGPKRAKEIKQKLSKSVKKSIKKTRYGIFFCPHCGKKFTDRVRLNGHHSGKHHNSVDSERLNKIWETRRKRYGPSGVRPRERSENERRKRQKSLKKAWKIRRQLYPPNGIKDPESFSKKITKTLENGEAKKRRQTCVERYGPTGYKNPEKVCRERSERMKNGLAKKIWKTRRERYGPLGRNDTKEYHENIRKGVLKSSKKRVKTRREHYGKTWYKNPEKVSEIHSKVQKEYYDSLSPEEKERLSTVQKEVWNKLTPKQKCKRIRKSHSFRRPNKSEQKLINILEENNFKYKYSGNHPHPNLGGKMPDFVHETKPKIIELFSGYWHRNDNPQDRIDYFKERGYDCLILWHRELKNTESIINKVEEFTNA